VSTAEEKGANLFIFLLSHWNDEDKAGSSLPQFGYNSNLMERRHLRLPIAAHCG